ncbi:MAG: transposase domain-containing protein [Nitrosomonadales bacterium]|nr:transposase domain-containing protein [Nitrosomonadales bacterium]
MHNFRGYSLIETCKANHVDPYGYWVALFCSFPLAWSADDFESLLPRRLAQAAS